MKEIVHIIPLGYEIDRATKPFEKYKANKAYLLVPLDSDIHDKELLRKHRYYLHTVKDQLEQLDITTHIIHTDMFDLQDVIKTVSRIVVKERAENNEVFVNVSSSGRLTSIGSALAAMANGAQAYYVEADDYSENQKEKLKHGLSICHRLGIKFLAPFQFKLPKENGIKLLVKLFENPKKKMKTIDAIEHLAKVGGEDWKEFKNFSSRKFPRSLKQKGLMKLNKGILTELEKNGYIVREFVGRYNTIQITESGRYIACISGITNENF
ncbi:MAG: transcriptional regulator [Dehalococcoidia bacterium]|nr:MAG: transcriptional regulator [Dehalococcoidia bacterium]